METGLTPPPSLGIRVIGVNMIHGVPDKLNIYVKVICLKMNEKCNDENIMPNINVQNIIENILECNGIKK